MQIDRLNTDFKLASRDAFTEHARTKGVETWNELIDFIKYLPYGRTSDRTDLGLVFIEQKGTCSSKHAVLKTIADLNHIPNIDLVLGMYRMTESNTPNIGTVLTDNSIAYIPEAHCYLKMNGRRIDLTTHRSDIKNIEDDLIQEELVTPRQVVHDKIPHHKEYLKFWLKETGSKFEFDHIWHIREQCIENLSE